MDGHRREGSNENLQPLHPPMPTAKIQYPPGYRFMPTDAELIMEYLLKKIKNLPIPIAEITDTYLRLVNPRVLTEKCPKIGDNDWYFFTPRDRKYPNGKRPDRGSESGYWKATGADKEVVFGGKVVGYRKALVFYEGKPQKGEKTNWIMHEFRVKGSERKKTTAKDMRLDDWVLCRLYEKSSRVTKRQSNGKVKKGDVADEESPSPTTIQDVQVMSSSDEIAAPNDKEVHKYGHFPGQEIQYYHEPININSNLGWYHEDLSALAPAPTFDSSVLIEDPAITNAHLHSFNWIYNPVDVHGLGVGYKHPNAWSSESVFSANSFPPNNTNYDGNYDPIHRRKF